MTSQLEQQQENLRRVVDQWRSKSFRLLNDLNCGDHFAPQKPKLGPIGCHVEPIEHAGLSSLLNSDNTAVSKLLTVLSFDCIEITKLRKFASRSLYRQLLLFGHRWSPQEVLLEGEPQKTFVEQLPLFMELYEAERRLREVLVNLVQQLNVIYSSSDDKNVQPLNLVKNFTLRSAFESLGQGLSVLVVLDEILKQNVHVKSYLSLFASFSTVRTFSFAWAVTKFINRGFHGSLRCLVLSYIQYSTSNISVAQVCHKNRALIILFIKMLNNVKLDLDSFDISVDDLELLDQVVCQLEKLLAVGFFQHLLLEEPSWNPTLQQVMSNKKFNEACTSCIYDGLSEILTRLDSWKEYPFDRRKILHHLALFLFSTYSSSVYAPEKKTWKLVTEMLQLVPVIYVEGGKRILFLDVLKSQFNPLLSSWAPVRQVLRDSGVMMINYLTRLSELQSRDWQAIRDSLSCWVASFQSTIHPLSETLSEACLRLHLKQLLQGILLANRMHILVLSMIDLHALLEIPIKREKLKSLCHMVISLKVLANTFQMKGLEIICGLPHIINIIEADIERVILPSKAVLHEEVVKGSQARRSGILGFWNHGGRDTDTKLVDSLTLILISLQLLQGTSSCERQLMLSITLDVLQSIGSLDINCSMIRKHMLKLATVADFQSIVEEVTDCGFLYWRKEMMESWFSMTYMDVTRFTWLQNLLDAFSDGLWLLKLGHVSKLTLQSFEKEVENALENEIIAPLCRDVETDLRLHVHSSHLKGSVFVNPTKTGVRNLSWCLHMRLLRLPFKRVNVRLLVESYLNSSFYNHTAVSSNDWKMYSEMRQLAELKYGLVLDDIDLAEHSQDFNINEVIQNLQIFVEKYSYNMLKQLFIKKFHNEQGRKNLKLISMDCVASSIAVHGSRTISTASSYIFEYVSQMFETLSASLNDKYLRSYLVEESNFRKVQLTGRMRIIFHGFRQFRSYFESLNPDANQGTFSKNVGRVSSPGDQGASFMEELQSIVTKMGNALGLMRILLAANSRHCCTVLRFLCRPRSDMSFAENVQKLGLPDEFITAGKVIDTVTPDIHESDDHIENWSSTINTFLKEPQSSRLHELDNFFLIIPPLILSMIDTKVHYKGKKFGKDHDLGNNVNSYDGFIMGVAFILKITEQDKLFDELDWFASMEETLEAAVASIQEQCKGPEQKRGSIAGFKLWSQSSTISSEIQREIDRHKSYQKEIELIECEFKLARAIMSSN